MINDKGFIMLIKPLQGLYSASGNKVFIFPEPNSFSLRKLFWIKIVFCESGRADFQLIAKNCLIRKNLLIRKNIFWFKNIFIWVEPDYMGKPFDSKKLFDSENLLIRKKLFWECSSQWVTKTLYKVCALRKVLSM